jgi:hypothetical protein
LRRYVAAATGFYVENPAVLGGRGARGRISAHLADDVQRIAVLLQVELDERDRYAEQDARHQQDRDDGGSEPRVAEYCQRQGYAHEADVGVRIA